MDLRETYAHRYQGKPILAKAPGRINIIGEHTDYNDGFVLPAAIDRYVEVAIGDNDRGMINAFAVDLNEHASIRKEELELQSKPDWLRFVAGVSRVMTDRGYNHGNFNIVFRSDIPIGAGLSSSAAIESAIGTGINELFDLRLEKEEIALIGQAAEHQYVGVKCGIMDQFASVFGLKDQAILLDCRSLERRYIPLDLKDHTIILCDTGVKHTLASSEYNTRRQECEMGVRIVKKSFPNVNSLRDVNSEMLLSVKDELDEKVRDRCSYVIEENNRVLETCKALEKGDMQKVGDYLYKSHRGLSTKYEVSCEELDFLVEKTFDMEHVAGARMMGGGFGGCTINLVRSDSHEQFINKISEIYFEKFNLELKCYTVRISTGARLVETD